MSKNIKSLLLHFFSLQYLPIYIKIVLKRTLLGVISATLVFSTAPNIEYQIALNKANNSSYIEKVLSSNDKTKEDKISQIYDI